MLNVGMCAICTVVHMPQARHVSPARGINFAAPWKVKRTRNSSLGAATVLGWTTNSLHSHGTLHVDP